MIELKQKSYQLKHDKNMTSKAFKEKLDKIFGEFEGESKKLLKKKI